MAAYPSDYPVLAVGADSPPGGRAQGLGLLQADKAASAAGQGEDPAEEAAGLDVSYHCLRPIWLAMQIVGFYPMHRFCRGRRPREPSVWLALSALQFGAVGASMGIAIWAVRARSQDGELQQDFDGVVIDYLVYMQCALPLAVLPLYATHRGAMQRYLRDWSELQAEFVREFGRPLSSCRGFGTRTSWEMVTVVSVFAVLSAGAQLLLHPAAVVLALVHSTLVSALLTSAFYLHGRLLRATARAIADNLALELRRPVPRVSAVDNIRLLVLRLVSLAGGGSGGLGSAVALALGTTMLLHFILATLTLYAVLGQVSYTYAARLPALGAGTALSGMLLYLACDTGHRVARAVKHLAVEELLAFHKRTTVIGLDLRKMVETFISTVQEVPSDLTLSGITTINRGLFTAMLSTMVTYLVVIVQFRISLEAETGTGSKGAGRSNASNDGVALPTLPTNETTPPTSTATSALSWATTGVTSPTTTMAAADNTTIDV